MAAALQVTPEQLLKTIDRDFLTCSVCLDQYLKPKILPCHHSFCGKCLQSMVDQHQELRCPTCRKPWRIPVGGVKHLDDNFYMNSLLDVVQNQGTDYTTRLKGQCEFCLEKQASHICVDCHLQHCCDKCSKVHKRATVSSSHRILTIQQYKEKLFTEPSAVRPVPYCGIHTTTRVEVYCDTCQKPVCNVCALIEHKRHNYKNLKDVAEKYIQELSLISRKLEKRSREADRAKEKVSLISKQLDKKCEKEKQRVMMKVDEVCMNIKMEGQRLVKEIDNDHDLRMKNNHGEVDGVEQRYSKLVSINSYIERLIQCGNAVQLLQNKETLTSYVKELLSTEAKPQLQSDMVEFLSSKEITASKILGVLRSDDVCLARCTVDNIPQQLIGGTSVKLLITTKDSNGRTINSKQAVTMTVMKPNRSKENIAITDNRDGTQTATFYGDTDGKHQVIVMIGNQEIPGSPFEINVLIPLLKTFGETGSEWGQYNTPTSLAINRHGHLIVADKDNHRIQIIDIDGKVVKVFSFKQFGKTFTPWDVAISLSGHYFITDYWNHQVVVSDDTGYFVRSFGQNQLKHPRGIAISPLNGQVYVTEWDGKGDDTDKDAHCVRKYTQDGHYISSFGKFGSQPGHFEAPYFIAATEDGKILVSDLNNHRIQVFNANDRFLFAFGRWGKNDGLFHHPTGVIVGKDKKIYVCDKSNRIQKFDITGKFLCRIDSGHDKLNEPRGIALTKETPAKLIVADGGNNCIKVFVQ